MRWSILTRWLSFFLLLTRLSHYSFLQLGFLLFRLWVITLWLLFSICTLLFFHLFILLLLLFLRLWLRLWLLLLLLFAFTVLLNFLLFLLWLWLRFRFFFLFSVLLWLSLTILLFLRFYLLFHFFFHFFLVSILGPWLSFNLDRLFVLLFSDHLVFRTIAKVGINDFPLLFFGNLRSITIRSCSQVSPSSIWHLVNVIRPLFYSPLFVDDLLPFKDTFFLAFNILRLSAFFLNLFALLFLFLRCFIWWFPSRIFNSLLFAAMRRVRERLFLNTIFSFLWWFLMLVLLVDRFIFFFWYLGYRRLLFIFLVFLFFGCTLLSFFFWMFALLLFFFFLWLLFTWFFFAFLLFLYFILWVFFNQHFSLFKFLFLFLLFFWLIFSWFIIIFLFITIYIVIFLFFVLVIGMITFFFWFLFLFLFFVPLILRLRLILIFSILVNFRKCIDSFDSFELFCYFSDCFFLFNISNFSAILAFKDNFFCFNIFFIFCIFKQISPLALASSSLSRDVCWHAYNSWSFSFLEDKI